MANVCIYQRFLPPDPSGAGKQALTLARALRASGCGVCLLTDGPAAGERRAVAGEFRTEYVASPPPRPRLRDWLGYWRRVATALVRLRSEFDVLHIHSAAFDQSAAAPLARLLGKQVLLRSSISGEFANLARYRGGRVQRKMLLSAGAVVAISQRLRQEYLDAGLPAARLRFIPNGVDTGLYRPASPPERVALREELQLPRNDRILIYHGAFFERKRLSWVVSAVEDLLTEIGASLVLVGGPARDEPTTRYAASLQAQVAASPARDRIIIRSHQDDVARYLQAADAYVLASWSEGISNALLEAMACGLVPIVSRTSGSEDLIEHGQTGLLFEPGDASALQQCVRRALCASDNDAAALRQGAVERIRNGYSIEVTAARYAAVYSELLHH